MRHKSERSLSLASEWGKADLHIHTRLSDGGPAPGRLIEHVARHTDLDVIAITDHDRIDGGLQVRERAASLGLSVVIGEEVSTADGHLLALFINEPIAPGRPIEQTIAEVHAQGGLAVAAHPFDLLSKSLLGRAGRPWSEEALRLLQLDGIEALNASLVRHGANARAGLLALALGFTALGSSDAHHLGAVGQAYTRFPGHTAEDLRQAILTGTAAAGGQSWRARQYLSWVAGCLIPRTIHRARGAVHAWGLT